MKALLAIIGKDLKLFFVSPKAVIITLLVPVAIGSFMGSLTNGGPKDLHRMPVRVVNQDTSAVSQDIVAGIKADPSLNADVVTEEEARGAVLSGKTGLAVVIPAGFGEAATEALFIPGEKPKLKVLQDPSKAMEAGMVLGLLHRHVMKAAGKAIAGKTGIGSSTGASAGPAAPGFSAPYDVVSEPLSRTSKFEYNGYSHSFGGMAIQFVLMFSIETGILLLMERKRGLWPRLRSAPVSKTTVLGGRALSSAVISLLSLTVCWTFCMLFLGVRVHGSWIAFLLCNVSFAVFAASAGLLLAALGKSPEATKGMSMFVVLLLVMLGGAWVPAFIFPEWLQKVSLLLPTRWAMDGFDGSTWRGLSFGATLLPSVVLLGYTAVFAFLAAILFKWEES